VVCVPVNLGWRADEVAYVLGHSRARGIVVETQLVAVMRDAIAKVPEVADVIVAPGTLGADTDVELSPDDRAWTTIGALCSVTECSGGYGELGCGCLRAAVLCR
jgi:long-subunit acyl-CoA synthetase (AMP-forming)